VTGRVPVDSRRVARGAAVAVGRFAIALTVYAVSAAFFVSEGPRSMLTSMARLPLWAVLVSTALVAWLLRLLRSPVDAAADLLVYGVRASGYAAARELVSRLSTSLPIDEVLPQLAETIGQVARAPRAEVRFWVAPEQRWRQVWPTAAAPQGDPLIMEVRHLGSDIGEIEIDQVDGPIDDLGRKRLGGIAAPVGAALATVRLTYALRLRRTELQELTTAIDASTRRLLDARHAAQRQFREQLASGVLPSLDAALTAATPEQAADDVSEALHVVRRISRGVFPPRLAEAGLAGCLKDWSDTTPGAVLGQVDEGWGADLRSCLYFSVVTTATELIDAGAAEVRIDVRGRAGQVELAVAADRVDVTDWPMPARDRLEAFDAVLSCDRGPGGSTLTALLPVPQSVAPAARSDPGEDTP